jgi:hypothetical protein
MTDFPSPVAYQLCAERYERILAGTNVHRKTRGDIAMKYAHATAARKLYDVIVDAIDLSKRDPTKTWNDLLDDRGNMCDE